MGIKTITIICLTLAVLVKEGQAIKCYLCGNFISDWTGSSTDGLMDAGMSESCVDSFNESGDGITIQECDGSCVKQKIAKDDKQIVARSCFPMKLDDGCQEKNDATSCACNTNLCNDATTWNLSITAFIVIIVGIMFAKYY